MKGNKTALHIYVNIIRAFNMSVTIPSIIETGMLNKSVRLLAAQIIPPPPPPPPPPPCDYSVLVTYRVP